MRLFETLLILADLLVFLSLVIPQFHAMNWIKYSALIAPAFALIQIVVEGPRWQMIPAYALAIIFFVIWLSGTTLPGVRHLPRYITIPGVVAGVLILFLAVALPVLLPVFRFPQPTGPYAIGSVTYHWVDESRSELFSTDPGVHRELIAQVWYPARNETSGPPLPYIPDAGDLTPAIGQLLHLPGFVFSHLKYVTTHAVGSAPIADDRPNYPVLIYLTGVDGFRSVSTFQIQELVSHGYIVVGLDQPGITPSFRLSSGQQISGLPRDQIQPLIDQSVVPQPKTPTLNGKALPDGSSPISPRMPALLSIS